MVTSSATIQTGEVHVWSLSFSDAESDIAILNLLLSDDEQARAIRFISDSDRTRFIVAVVYCVNSCLFIPDTPPDQSNWSMAAMAGLP